MAGRHELELEDLRCLVQSGLNRPNRSCRTPVDSAYDLVLIGPWLKVHIDAYAMQSSLITMSTQLRVCCCRHSPRHPHCHAADDVAASRQLNAAFQLTDKFAHVLVRSFLTMSYPVLASTYYTPENTRS